MIARRDVGHASVVLACVCLVDGWIQMDIHDVHVCVSVSDGVCMVCLSGDFGWVGMPRVQTLSDFAPPLVRVRACV